MIKPKKKRGSNKLYLWTVIHKSKKAEEVPVERVIDDCVEILNKRLKIETHKVKGSYRSYFNTKEEADTFIKNKLK